MTPGGSERERASLARRLIVGPLGVLSWLIAMLLLLVSLPLVLLLGALGGRAARRLLRRSGAAILLVFFLGYLPLLRFHAFAELPPRAARVDHAPCVFAANHRSWLDALLALALFPRVLVPVKSSYLRIPVLGVAMRWMGCLPVDASAPASVIAAVAAGQRAVAAGESLFVFPEGTRAPGTELLLLNDVFFRVALECDVPVVPVLIHSDVRYLAPRDERLIPARRPTWRVRLLDAVRPDQRDRAADIGRQVRRRLAAGLDGLDRPSAVGAAERNER
jgi:1-acyl-sn-glycerol-3-phosphate acyltransferase